MIGDKVASFIIVGGQGNEQGVAGQMLGFFSELGFHLLQFPCVADSRGWSEDMEHNVASVKNSVELADGARAFATRAIVLSQRLLATSANRGDERLPRGGRKAHALKVVT
jgi:hypothetical protein